MRNASSCTSGLAIFHAHSCSLMLLNDPKDADSEYLCPHVAV